MRPNLITRLKEEWNNLDHVDPLRGLIADTIDALAERPSQLDGPTEKELSDGLAMALHDAVLIRIGGNDEATRQAYARIDKLVGKYRAENPDIKPAQQQEPIAWIERDMQCDDFDPDSVTCQRPDIAANGWEWTPLYTSPPASKPLTDEQAKDAARYAFLIEQFGVTTLPCMLERELKKGYIKDGKASIDAAIDAAIEAAHAKGDA
jgi:hypothetical protein